MKKFNKKAIFAALMGALSSVSSFAVGGRTIENAQLYKSKNEKSLKFLSKNDKNLSGIFNQIATIEYENFDGTISKPLNSGVVTTRWRREKNLEVFREHTIIPKAYEWRAHYGGKETTKRKRNQITDTLIPNPGSKTPTINPGLDLDDSPARQRKINEKAKKYENEFLNDKANFLMHVDRLGKVDGFIKFEVEDKENEKIFVDVLANNAQKNGTGIAGLMIQTLQKNYQSIELNPVDDHAESFYKHYGFNEKGSNMLWVRK